MLDFEAFIATRREPTDDEWESILLNVQNLNPNEELNVSIYADAYMIHEQGGEYWVHAWWYPPIAYPTLADAEAKLYPWYQEFADA